MTRPVVALILCVSSMAAAQNFSCPNGQIDVMKYFAMEQARRATHFMIGKPNPIYTEVFPNQDFTESGYWFWLKSSRAHGFDVKAFDPDHVYMRSTELKWEDNRTFKRFLHDLPIAARCVTEGKAGPEIKTSDTTFRYFSSCRPYKTSTVGTAITDLDAPVQMDAGGNIGKVWTRVLHYHYNCDKNFQNCKDEEQFYLANGYGLWQWQHYKNGSQVKSALMNNTEPGRASATLPCADSYH
ncbi:MAG TPA: hypothetical protein VGV15_13965 [Terriglobales bacterium]|nr:hypothetical protein [Terriglobales bacterium]